MQSTVVVILAAFGRTLVSAALCLRHLKVPCAPEEGHIACIRNWLSAIGSIIAAAALLVAFQQFGLASDTRERQLRAYIFLETGAISRATIDNGPGIIINIRLKNSGPTPAYRFTTWIMPPAIREPTALPFGPPRPVEERNGESVIGASSDAIINFPYAWKDGELDAVRRGEKAIFVWGGADYTDAFGHRRRFVFRQTMSGLESEQNGTAWPLAPHKSGYDAD